MLKSDYKKNRKTRSDKFPLTLHKTGQYCKKIKGKIYYFGTDKKLAQQRYLEQAAMFYSGKALSSISQPKDVSLKHICNLYLEHQMVRASIGQIKVKHVYDQKLLLRDFVRSLTPNRQVSEIVTIDIQNYVTRLIRKNKSANTINNRITAIKSLFKWAIENELIEHGPNLKAVKKITKIRSEKPVFSTEQIGILLRNADLQMKTMILLGLNCGFGCTDCAELKWENLDLKKQRVVFPRGKTGVHRNLVLWPETVNALENIPKQGELVFYTVRKNPWVRMIHSKDKSGNEKFTKEDGITKQFSKLLKKANIKTEKGVGFYTLRRTAATLAARSGDPFAVQRLLGHTDLKMASVYVQDVSEQTDRVVDNVRKIIMQENVSSSIDRSGDIAGKGTETKN